MPETSRHVASLVDGEQVYEDDLGIISELTARSFPLVHGMSLRRIVLQPGAVREPQWNVDANQIAYVVRGRVLVSTLGNADSFSTFVVGPGQMFHVESGAVHHIENVGSETGEVIAALRSERPTDFSLHDSVAAMTDNVLGNCYDLPGNAFAVINRGQSPPLSRRRGPARIPDGARLPNARLFDCEGQRAPLSYSYGSAHLARRQYWAALDDLSMYSLRVHRTGMREPHWHPITAELGYVQQGHARMTVLDPDGSLDTYELHPGQAYFIPRAYPHHIEALGDEGIHFLIFFDQPTPGDIGYRATASAFSRDVLAEAFGVPENQLPTLPFTPVDPLLVEKRNPEDPSG